MAGISARLVAGKAVRTNAVVTGPSIANTPLSARDCAGRDHGLFGARPVVLDDEFEWRAVHAAGLVDLVERDLGGDQRVLPVAPGRPRALEIDADADRLRLRERRAAGEQCHAGESGARRGSLMISSWSFLV